ncbi:nuclear transport factor 2 family protein [Mangrovivirga cuniculi]|nr:nuclear transport factor 2 family protein [Mangrovivirga cuniculi]
MQVVQGFGAGMASGTDSWKEFIADTITFDGPAAQVKGIEEFIGLNEGFMSMVRGNRMKKAVEIDNYVITQVEIDVEMPTGKTITLDMSEWYETENGKIMSIKVYYDAEEFRKESV